MPIEEPYIYQLAKYLKSNLAKGYTIESLRTALEHQDYSRSAIDRATKLANEQLAKQAPQMKEKPKIKYKIVSDGDAIKEFREHEKDTTKKSFLRRLFG